MEPDESLVPLLEIKNLKHYYDVGTRIVPAVDGVDLSLFKGEIVGIVGESGCGKSTVVRSLMGLVDSTCAKRVSGEAIFEGDDLFKMSEKKICKIRGKKIAMIFQNPLSALDPVYTVGEQIMEMLLLHEPIKKKEARIKAIELLN